MKSLERRLVRINTERQYHGGVINFNKACEGGKFSRRLIGQMFKKHVPKEEYAGSNVREILEYAYARSWCQDLSLNSTSNEGETAQEDAQKVEVVPALIVPVQGVLGI